MKITFEDLSWRFDGDKRQLCRLFKVQDDAGKIKKVVYNIATGECKVYCEHNTFEFYCHAFIHITKGLERSILSFATLGGRLGEIAMFPNGRVAIVVNNLPAPSFAIEKQRSYFT